MKRTFQNIFPNEVSPSATRHRPTVAKINLAYIQENFKLIRALLPRGQFICPMVKANAYGHGDVEVTAALTEVGAAQVGVGLVEEGAQLRDAGLAVRILLFAMFNESSVQDIVRYQLTPVVSDLAELEILAAYIKRPFQVHLKFNTGMNRLGLEPSEATKAKQLFEKYPLLKLGGVCTHLWQGEDAGEPNGASQIQLECLKKVFLNFKQYSPVLHALNSSAIFNSSLTFASSKLANPITGEFGARPGIAIYGAPPAVAENSAKSTDWPSSLRLKPALSLTTKIVLLHEIKTGETVSYGAKWQAKRDSLIGALPIGYADGFFRGLTNQCHVLVHGQLAPIVGTVCMDYVMVDLTELAKTHTLQVGDDVVIIGRQGDLEITADDLAKKLGTISYEVFTRIGERVPRTYST